MVINNGSFSQQNNGLSASANIVFWPINGVGIGHTVRLMRVCEHLSSRANISPLFITEDSHQEAHVNQRLRGVSILRAPRPWKRQPVQLPAEGLQSVLRAADLLIGDMGGVPPLDALCAIAGRVIPCVFLLRWMNVASWHITLRRLAEYGNSATAIVVLPKDIFESWVSPSGTPSPPNVKFLPGFIGSDHHLCSRFPSAGARWAFTCGLGGVHSASGQRELEEALLGFADATKNAGRLIEADIFPGRNSALAKLADELDVFARVVPFTATSQPHWCLYDVVMARPGYNTIIEIMRSASTLVVATFENSDEWSSRSLAFLSDYGTTVVDPPFRSGICKAVVSSSNRSCADRYALYERRRHAFPDATDSATQIICSVGGLC